MRSLLMCVTCSEIDFQTTLSMMLLSLAGAGCIVTNQSVTSIKCSSDNINSIIRGTLHVQ